MKHKDERMKIMNEILNGIKVSNKLVAISGVLLLYLALVRLGGYRIVFPVGVHISSLVPWSINITG